MDFAWRKWFQWRWLPLTAAMALLTLAAGVFAYLAVQENRRAEETASVLVHDYASFVGEKFLNLSGRIYSRRSGLVVSSDVRESPESAHLPFAQLRDYGRNRAGGAALPRPKRSWVRYFFVLDLNTGRFEASGAKPDSGEVRLLEERLAKLPPCSAESAIPMPSLHHASSMKDPSWSAIVETDSLGAAGLVYGFAVDQKRLAEDMFENLLEPGDCGCPGDLLPESLASVGDISQAASLVLRDGAGSEMMRAGPALPSAGAVVKTFESETPLHGWTLEVAINPEILAPLLPAGGLPWPWLGLLGALVAVSAALGVRSLRRGEELMRLQQSFVSNVSHELKTPLAKIRLFNELLASGRPGAQRGERYRGVIDRECRRLALLVDNVLRFSRQERGADKLSRRPVDLNELVHDAVETFRASSGPKRHRFACSQNGEMKVEGDSAALQQAIVNLLDNAVKYSPEGSPIEVRVGRENGHARIEVEDRGPGIPAEERRRIFREFYRLHSGDDQEASGSGLGLALVRRTVEAHGGRVSVRPADPRGSVFTLEIPSA